MKNSLVKAIFIGSIIHATAVTTSSAEGRWSRVAPQGAGFSIEAPGEPQPGAETGQICLHFRVVVSSGQVAGG
jgi:hypothetical protein